MKILFVCDYYDDKQLYQEPLLTKYYVHLAHEVFVATSHHNDVFTYVSDKINTDKHQITELGKYGEKIFRLPYTFNILNKIKKFTNLNLILHQVNPDLVYLHGISFNLHEVVKYKKSNPSVRIIMDYHADYSNSGKNWISINILHKVIRRGYFRMYLKHISKIFPIVPEGIRFLSEVYGVNEEKMELLPLGVDTIGMRELQSTSYEYENAIRRRFNIPENSFIIVSGGKLNGLKRTELVINSLKYLSNEVHLLVFGVAMDQNYKEHLEYVAKGLNVHFLGWLTAEDTLKTFFLSDLAVFPASQSVLWQQAIGAGLPLIVGDSGGQSAEYMNKHNNIIVVGKEKLEMEAFGKIVKNLVEDKGRLLTMAKGAHQTTEEFLDYKIIAAKTLTI